MKILHTVATLDPASGGPARSVPQLARALAAAGHEVGLWAPQAVDCLSDTGPEQDSGLVVFSGDFATALDAFGVPDLVHDHGIWLPCHKTVAGVCVARGIPRVVSPRGMLEPWALNHKKWKKRVAWYLYQRSLLESAAALHATAESEAAQFRKLGLTRPIILAANGVAEDRTSNIERPTSNIEIQVGRDGLGAPISSRIHDPQPERSGDGRRQSTIHNPTRTALFLSRIHPKKGLPLLLEAWAQVRPQGWQLRIVGPDEGGHVAALKELCVKLGLGWGEIGRADPARSADTTHEGGNANAEQTESSTTCNIQHPTFNILFSRPLEGEEKWTAFREADLFVLPTYSENFGIAIAEALACGVPVITTKGAPWQGLHERQCGWWTDISTDAIAAALQEACTSDPATLHAMGVRGREWMRRDFAWDGIAAEMLATYEWILGGGAKPGCVR